LIRIERPERGIGQPEMDILSELDCGLGAARNEGQREGSAEELNDFASSHFRTPVGE
jgi:hypothetical protein